MEIDLKTVLADVKYWVKQAGDMQKLYFRKQDLVIETKTTEVDLVTEVDDLSEKFLLEQISNKYPQHAVLSEESGEKNIISDYQWIIDPLDGTTNYAQGLPIFSISVALQYKKETVLGVVYVPMLNELYQAIKGEKAYLNEKEIRVGEKSELRQSVLATGFPYDKAIHQDNNAAIFASLVPKVRGLRRLGSAAYDLANVAAGVYDGFWELNLSLWDVAAGILLVQEAGGVITYLPEKRGISLVAGNEAIQDLILKEIKNQ